MVYKKWFFVLLIIFPFAFLAAQESVESAELTEENHELNYYLDRSGREPRFIQKLFWEGDEYVLRYVLIIEQRAASGNYIEVERMDAKDNFAEVSLIAGHYRFKLDVYDLFDDYAFTTDWFNFEVIRAVQPHISSFSPGNFYLDEEEEWIITVRGNNFLPQTVFFLVQGNTRLRPQRVTIEENVAYLQFSGGSLSPGRYNIYARNPGGLDDSEGTFGVSNKKPVDLNITVGYAPLIPVMGYLFQDGFSYEGNHNMEAPFPDAAYPLSAVVRISFLPLKRTWGYIGVEASGSFSMLSSERSGYSTNANLINAHLSFLYQKHFLKRTFFVNLSAGGGIFAVMDFSYDFNGRSLGSTSHTFMSAIGGLSLTYIFKKPWFATAGADFIQVFTPSPTDTPFPALIRPFIGAGVQL